MELDVEQAIFENAGQAVHVAFLIMAQEAKQATPLRAALIRAMESIQLSGRQRAWLDDLRGAGGGSTNFSGLDDTEVRAQCAMVTQAVQDHLPLPEMWVLQAKYGQTDFEDVIDDALADGGLGASLALAQQAVVAARRRLAGAIAERDTAVLASDRKIYFEAKTSVASAWADVIASESKEQTIKGAIDQAGACRRLDNGRAHGGSIAPRRRFAFSLERIAAIQGLTDYLAPLIPTVPALAIDSLLGLVFANHKKLDITYRDIAESFGGSHVKYYRAVQKLKMHLRQLELMAIERLEPRFAAQGVINKFPESI